MTKTSYWRGLVGQPPDMKGHLGIFAGKGGKQNREGEK